MMTKPDTPTPATSRAAEDGYATAFYEIASVLGIGARSDTPENVFRNVMLPRIKRMAEVFGDKYCAECRKTKGADPAAQAASPAPLTDEEILALNRGERFFSESPSKYPEAGHGTQYHAGAPGLLGFAGAVLALASPQVAPAPHPLIEAIKGQIKNAKEKRLQLDRSFWGTERGAGLPLDELELAVWEWEAGQSGCTVPPAGWWCSRTKGHKGPCAARPVTLALVAPTPAQPSLDDDERAHLGETLAQLESDGETTTDYDTLIDWAERGFLRCKYFEITAEGWAAILPSEPEGEA